MENRVPETLRDEEIDKILPKRDSQTFSSNVYDEIKKRYNIYPELIDAIKKAILIIQKGTDGELKYLPRYLQSILDEAEKK